MDTLPQSSSENESLHRVTSEEPTFQGNLNLQVQQEGDTNYVSWSTSAYNAYPYVTLTRRDTTNDTGLVKRLNHAYKYSPPYPDHIDAPAGDVYAYTVVLSNKVRVGPQETVDETVLPTVNIDETVLPTVNIMAVLPIEDLPVLPVEEQPIAHAPVEVIHESPLIDVPSVVSEEHIQE